MNVTGFAVGTTTTLIPFDEGLPTFIDSGGAFIFLPLVVCDNYYAHAPYANSMSLDVNHNGNPSPVHVYPCEQTLPDLTVGVGDYKVTIPGKLLQGARYKDDSKSISIFIDTEEQPVCHRII